MSDNKTLYLIRYDVTSGPDKGQVYWGYLDRQSKKSKGMSEIYPLGHPWLIDVKTRNKWARAFKKYGPDADRSVAGASLDLCAFGSEKLARETAKYHHPGAYDGCDGVMSFPTTTLAKLTASKMDPEGATK